MAHGIICFSFFLHLTIIFDGRLVLAILQLKLLATSLKKRENALCMVCGTPKGHSVPTKTPSPEATRSNPGKAKSYEPNALNETMLPMWRKKSITISPTQHRTTPISTPISK